MPNHVLNEIIFKDVGPSVQEEILSKALKNGFVDFSVLIPVPLNIWHGNIGQKEEKAFGKNNWHDWNKENWGTKWNAYGKEEYGPKMVRTEDTLTFYFQTAWSPPIPWLVALFNATQHPFEYNYLSEGNNKAFTGKFFFSVYNEKDSDPHQDWEEIESNDEAFNRRMRILLWGEDIDENNKQE
jgi:hypothetical protein